MLLPNASDTSPSSEQCGRRNGFTNRAIAARDAEVADATTTDDVGDE